MQLLQGLVLDGSLIPGLCHMAMGYYFLSAKAAYVLVFPLLLLTVARITCWFYMTLSVGKKGWHVKSTVLVSQDHPGMVRGRSELKFLKKKFKNCLLLVDQWNTVSLLHSIGFEFINENECGEVLGRNWRKRKEIHLPNIIKRSKVFSVIDFF